MPQVHVVNVADAHVVVEDTAWERLEQIKAELKTQIGAKFGISHSTLEFERNGVCDAEAPLFGHDDAHGHGQADNA